MNSELSHLKDILISKYKSGTMAHFYTLTINCELEDAMAWLEDLLINIIEKKHPRDHQDILFIETEEKKYTLKNNEFRDFFSFLGTRPIELTRKFIIIKDAHKISDTIANKLLKTLEEPEVEASIFLINSAKQEIMPTISSRAINLNINDDSSKDSLPNFNSAQEFIDSHSSISAKLIAGFLKTRSNTDLVTGLKDKAFDENEFIKLITQVCTYYPKKERGLSSTIETLKEYELQREYNNTLAHRVTFLVNKVL